MAHRVTVAYRPVIVSQRPFTVTYWAYCDSLLSAWYPLSVRTQGGKKLCEHRFLACLEGSYSDIVKL